MEHWLWIILAALSFECKGQDTVTQTTGEVSATEGDTVTIGCTFKTSNTAYLFWYKQEVNGYPKYMLMRYSAFGENAAEFQKDRFDATLNKTSVALQISSAAVTDSAVYYCALRPTVTGNTNALYKNLWMTDSAVYYCAVRPTVTGNTNTLYKHLCSFSLNIHTLQIPPFSEQHRHQVDTSKSTSSPLKVTHIQPLRETPKMKSSRSGLCVHRLLNVDELVKLVLTNIRFTAV
ncbi:uncharacterized protein LOC117553188 [Gymnodraco acuticeps]|uniref:Uncharacterized protein LOC117553188 n=1 Tax=Gymnodraco acuticeps TaxID=8218 RepID=A0A6P8UY89_GYMAC|nr:uncharacterized protein LOC117553188 [Gymnodraco acuticeps]